MIATDRALAHSSGVTGRGLQSPSYTSYSRIEEMVGFSNHSSYFHDGLNNNIAVKFHLSFKQQKKKQKVQIQMDVTSKAVMPPVTFT